MLVTHTLVPGPEGPDDWLITAVIIVVLLVVAGLTLAAAF